MIHVTNNYVSGSHRFYTVGTGTSNDDLTTLSTQPKYEILRMERSNVSITGHMIPSSCNVFDLGSSNLRFRDLYLSGNTIDLGGTRISRDDTTGGMKITSPTNQPLDFQANHLIVNGNIGIGTNVPLSQLDVRGNIVCSNISVIGDFVTLNTITSNTEQMVIENAGTEPALKVTQIGNNSVAEFYDKESGVALFVGNGGNVGIGTTVPQASLDVSGNININGYQCVNGCAFKVIQSTSQTIPHNTNTLITFQSKIFDTHTCFNLTTNRFTPTVGGYYSITGCIRLNGSDIRINGAVIYKNGSIYSSAYIQNNGNNGGSIINDIVYLNGSTDYIQLYCFQNNANSTSSSTYPLDNPAPATNTCIWLSGCMMRGI